MTAARTKEHEEQKHTGIWKEKIRKVGSKEQKQENLTEGTHSNKYSRLCYKAEPGTLSHHLPYSSYSRRQRYQVSLLPLLSPPSTNKSTKTKQNCQDSGAAATQVPLISRTGTLPHDLPCHFGISRCLLYTSPSPRDKRQSRMPSSA